MSRLGVSHTSVEQVDGLVLACESSLTNVLDQKQMRGMQAMQQLKFTVATKDGRDCMSS